MAGNDSWQGPILSVIIPVRNGAETIERAIVSCTSSEVRELEVVVVENGSSDATPSVLSKLQYPNVHILTSEEKGRSAARNLGIMSARGQYIAFLDADDEMEPGGLAGVVHTLKGQAPDAIWAPVAYEDEGGREWTVGTLPGQRMYSRLLVQNMIPISGIIVRRDLCARFPNGVEYCEDWRFWLETLKGVRPLAVDIRLARIHVRATSTSANQELMKAYEIPIYLDYFSEHLPFIDRTKQMVLLAASLVVYSRIERIPEVEARLQASGTAQAAVKLLRAHTGMQGVARTILRKILRNPEVLK